MSNPATAARPSAAPAQSKLTFGQMSIVQKGVFLVKVMLMIVTFGFAYPNILGND